MNTDQIQRPFRAYPSELLVYLFWNTPETLEGWEHMCEQIHVEMNLRGEGGKVAV